jgi:hypothetical protein
MPRQLVVQSPSSSQNVESDRSLHPKMTDFDGQPDHATTEALAVLLVSSVINPENPLVTRGRLIS